MFALNAQKQSNAVRVSQSAPSNTASEMMAMNELLRSNASLINQVRASNGSDPRIVPQIEAQLKKSVQLLESIESGRHPNTLSNSPLPNLVCQIKELTGISLNVQPNTVFPEPQPQPQTQPIYPGDSNYFAPFNQMSTGKLVERLDDAIWFVDNYARYPQDADKDIVGILQELKNRMPGNEFQQLKQHTEKRLLHILANHFNPLKPIEPLFFNRERRIAMLVGLGYKLGLM